MDILKLSVRGFVCWVPTLLELSFEEKNWYINLSETQALFLIYVRLWRKAHLYCFNSSVNEAHPHNAMLQLFETE